MKLDPRIKSVSDILTPFDVERAEQLIGQKGFFANNIDCFGTSDPYCVYGTLTRVFGHKDQTDPYLKMEGGDLYSFFLPESSLKPEEKKPEGKKYRPYTPQEFCDKFQIGQPIKFRNKGDAGSEQYGDLQGLWYKRCDGKTIAYAIIESSGYALDELFNDFEWRGLFKRDFEPFGVEVEE